MVTLATDRTDAARHARTRDGPAKLGKLDDHRQERWQLPLSRFIEELYSKQYGNGAPDTVISIEERLRREREKKAATRRAAGADRGAAAEY